MTSLIERKLQNYPSVYVTDSELSVILDGTDNSRHAQVKRALAKGELKRIKRGLYTLDKQLASTKPHPFELAQRIYGPSYISLESALSYHNLIPEAVYEVTSVTSKRQNKFSTPLGIFSYLHAPQKNLFIEVDRIEENGRYFFMATPWKAITDYVFCYKKTWKSIDPIINSLRIELDDLAPLEQQTLIELNNYYNNRRVTLFLAGIKRDLNL